MPVILALRRLKPEDHEFKASLDYTVTPCLKKKKKTEKEVCVLKSNACV
jgi:hypothetical protein